MKLKKAKQANIHVSISTWLCWINAIIIGEEQCSHEGNNVLQSTSKFFSLLAFFFFFFNILVSYRKYPPVGNLDEGKILNKVQPKYLL